MFDFNLLLLIFTYFLIQHVCNLICFALSYFLLTFNLVFTNNPNNIDTIQIFSSLGKNNLNVLSFHFFVDFTSNFFFQMYIGFQIQNF